MTSRRFASLAVPVLATTLLALPAAAMARGGDGGGGATSPTPAPATCVSATPTNSGVVDKPASRKPITVDLSMSNCGGRAVTIATSLVGTTSTLRSYDPWLVSTCATAPYSAPGLTLKPGETRSIEAAALTAYCGYSPWGLDVTYEVVYDVTVTDVATGAVLTTTSSVVRHQGGA
jgi:hypothetical protein